MIMALFPCFSVSGEFAEESLEELMFNEIPNVFIASGKDESISEAPANVFAITGTEMQRRGYKTLLDLIYDLPGTTYINQVGYLNAGQIVTRGIFYSKRIKLMLNGMTIDPRNGNGTGWCERFPVTGIERVEFIIGPYASLYGRNTFSGAMNIVTKDPKNMNILQANVLYGTYNQVAANIVSGKKLDSSDFYVSLYKNKSDDGWDLPKEYPDIYSLEARRNGIFLGEPVVFPEGVSTDFYAPWDNTDLYVKLDHECGLAFESNFNQAEYSKVASGLTPLFYAANDESMTRDTVWSSRLSYYFKPSDRFSSKTLLGYQTYEWRGGNIFLFAPDQSKWFLMESESFNAEEQIRFKFTDKNELYAGLSYESVDDYPMKAKRNGLPKFSSNEGIKLNYTNLTLQDEIKAMDNLQFVVGLMYEQSNSYKDVIVPRCSVMWTLAEQTVLKFLYGGGYLTPSPTTRGDQLVPGVRSSSVKGVTDLNPEFLTSYDVTLIHNFDENTDISVSIFLNKIKDIISTIRQGPEIDPLFGMTWKNQGKKESKGIEFNFNSKIGEKTKTFISYGFVDGSYDVISEDGNITSNDWLPTSVKNHVKAGINFLMLQNKLNLFIHDLYIGDQSTWTEAKLDGYNVVDINLMSTANLNKSWYFSFGVRNVFDEEGFTVPTEYDPDFLCNLPIRKRYWHIQAGVKY